MTDHTSDPGDELLDPTALDEISTLANVIAQASAHDGDVPSDVLDAALGISDDAGVRAER